MAEWLEQTSQWHEMYSPKSYFNQKYKMQKSSLDW